MPDIVVVGARGMPDAEGGAEKHAAMLFPLFVEAGYSVTLLGLREGIRGNSHRGVALKVIPTLDILGTDKLIYHLISFLYAFFTRPTLVHLQGLNSALFLVLYKLAGLKTVVRYASTDHTHGKWGLAGRIGFRLCEAQLPLADGIICVSQRYQQDLSAKYAVRNIDVILNGVDTPDVPVSSQNYLESVAIGESPYVLSVGRLTVDKDYATIIDAVERLRGLNLRLVIAGGPDEKGYSKRLLARQSSRVRFLGRVDRPLLPALYAGCVAYVSASHHEGLSNSILEAVAHKRPLIVTDIIANRQMDLPEDSYFRVSDAAALACKIQEAIADPERFTLACHKFPTWAEVCEQTRRVYAKVVPEVFGHKRNGLGHESKRGNSHQDRNDDKRRRTS